jgi:rhodanese-related sulfurtransferase
MLLFVFISLIGFSCSQSGAQAQSKTSPDDFEALLAELDAVQLIDVRTPEEYADGHLDGARLMNYHDTDFSQNLETLDKTKPVMVYCALGGRSGKAARKLTELGFQQVYDLDGGITAWRAAGKKTVK